MTKKAKIIYILLLILISGPLANAYPQKIPLGSAYNVKNFGAKGDSITPDTKAISKAIDAIEQNGGGILYFPPGTYLTGTIYLVDHLTIHISAGAKILGLPFDDPSYGRRGETRSAVIEGMEVSHVAIIGQGIVDGGGVSSGCNTRGCAERTIDFNNARHIRIKGITILHGGHTALELGGSHDVVIHSILMDTNRDGIHVDGTNITISDVILNSDEDDVLVFKSSPGTGYYTPTSNVTLANAYVSGYKPGSVYDGTYIDGGGVGRIKFGTESVGGGFKNITIDNVIFDHCRGLDLVLVDGGVLENILISNIVMNDVSNSPIYIRLGDRSPSRAPKNPPPGILRNITISNLVATGANSQFTSVISGIPGHPIKNVSLNNIRLIYTGGGTKEMAKKIPPENVGIYPEPGHFGMIPSYGFYVRHTKDVQLNNVSVEFEKEDERPAFIFRDVRDLQLYGIKTERASSGEPPVVFRGYNKQIQVNSSPSIPIVALKVSEIKLSKRKVKAGEAFSIMIGAIAKGEGLGNIKLLIDGKKVKTKNKWLLPKTKNEVEFKKIKVYKKGKHTIQVGDVKATVSVMSEQAKIVLFDLIAFSPWVNDLNVNASIQSSVLTAQESAVIQFNAKNVGSFLAEKTLKLKISEKIITSRVVRLQPGESTKISFDYTFPASGYYNIAINGLHKRVYAWNKSGKFQIKNLKLKPSLPIAGEPFKVEMDVSNTEFRDGARVVLYINSEPIDSAMVMAKKDQEKKLKFQVGPRKKGHHILSVRNAKDSVKKQSAFTIIKRLKPEDISISKQRVSVHEPDIVSATIINEVSQDANLTYHLLVDGKVAQSKKVHIPPDSTETLQFIVRFYKLGKHKVTIDSLAPLPIMVVPAKTNRKFQYGKLQISQSILALNDSSDIRSSIQNITTEPQHTHVTLRVNGKVVKEKEVSISAGESSKISFTHSFSKKGVYKVSIDNEKSKIIKVGMNLPPASFSDHSGNNYTSKVIGKTFWVKGQFGKGLKFDAPENWSELDSINFSRVKTSLTPDDVGPAGTVSLWYKPNWDYQNKNSIRPAIIENHNGFVLFDASNQKETDQMLFLAWGDEGRYLSFNVEDQADRDYEAPDDETAETGELPVINHFQSGKWYHIITTWNFKSQPHIVALFVNGKKIAQTKIVGQRLPSFKPFTFGANRQDDTYAHGSANGIIDEIKIYNRVLNPKEIQQLYRKNQNIQKGLMLYLPFD